jgi:hypothetical protein
MRSAPRGRSIRSKSEGRFPAWPEVGDEERIDFAPLTGRAPHSSASVNKITSSGSPDVTLFSKLTPATLAKAPSPSRSTTASVGISFKISMSCATVMGTPGRLDRPRTIWSGRCIIQCRDRANPASPDLLVADSKDDVARRECRDQRLEKLALHRPVALRPPLVRSI